VLTTGSEVLHPTYIRADDEDLRRDRRKAKPEVSRPKSLEPHILFD
jgi:hypothetical protein